MRIPNRFLIWRSDRGDVPYGISVGSLPQSSDEAQSSKKEEKEGKTNGDTVSGELVIRGETGCLST
jgi:hypothetical protein